MLQSECLRIANNASWWTGNRQIHKDFGVPIFCNHIRSLTKRFNLKVSWCGEPLSSAAWQIFTMTKCWLQSPKASHGRPGSTKLVITICQKMATSAYWIMPIWLFLITLNEVFTTPFFSVVRRMPGCNRQRQGTAWTLPRHGDFTWVPGFRCESYLRHDQSGFESWRAFQPKLWPLIKAYCLLSNNRQFVHVEAFDRDRTFVGISTIPLIV